MHLDDNGVDPVTNQMMKKRKTMITFLKHDGKSRKKHFLDKFNKLLATDSKRCQRVLKQLIDEKAHGSTTNTFV